MDDDYKNPLPGKTYTSPSLPESITFDELYERAKFIVQHNQS